MAVIVHLHGEAHITLIMDAERKYFGILHRLCNWIFDMRSEDAALTTPYISRFS